MPYVPFHSYFPEIAERETRTLILPKPAGGLPQGQYSLIEMFCDEAGCDCRRVFLYVVASFRKGPEAVVGYGWEDPEYYIRWMKDDDPVFIKALKGPELNLASPQSDLAPAILDLVEKVALKDQAFVERVKRHYHMFRARVDEQASSHEDSPISPKPRSASEMASRSFPRLVTPPPASTAKTNRNEPCPCGSGKKFKKCCQRKG